MATKKTKLPTIVRRDQKAFDESVRLAEVRRAELAAQVRQAEWLRHAIDGYIEEADRGEMLEIVLFLGLPATPALAWRSTSEKQRERDLKHAADLEREADQIRRRAQ